MKSKKGFTLIELLAVIVILAIIALIATPIIIGVIDDARKGAFENTSYGVLEGLKLDYVERTSQGVSAEEKTYNFPNSGLKLSGEEPAYGEASIDSKGGISFALADKDKRWCAKKEANSEKVTVEDYTKENCKIEEISGNDAIKDGTVVYLDPTTGKKCDTYVEANSATGVKTGCMKWYTFAGNNNSETVNLLLDHNTTALVAWNTKNDNTDSSEIGEKLASDATGWVSGLNPRLITADEIAQITGNTNFNSATSTGLEYFYLDTNSTSAAENRGPGTSKFAWLFDRTYDCTYYGCNIADQYTHGYWTNTSVYGTATEVWYISHIGRHGNLIVSSDSNYGIRPVITINKSIIL